MIACSGYSERALSLIGGTAREHPELPIVVLSQSSPDGFLSRLFEMGADDVVRLPESPERVRFTLQKVVARRRAMASTSGAGERLDDLRPRAEGRDGQDGDDRRISRRRSPRPDKRVAVIDLDLQFGDVALCMGVRPETTIHDLANSPGLARRRQARARTSSRTSRAREFSSRRRGPTTPQ